MTEQKPPDSDSDSSSKFTAAVKRSLEQALYQSLNWFSVVRSKTEGTRHQLKEVLYSTSDQVLEKAEETRKSVKMRMAILEIEHHLNRLYPQIGKLTCDLSKNSPKSGWPKDKNLKTKVDLAEEYRERLEELKQELIEHQQRSRGNPK